MTPTFDVDTTSTTQPASIDVAPLVAPGESSDPILINAILAELQALLGDKRYTLWIEGKIGLSICDDSLTIAVGSPFLLSWMQRQFKESMTEAARAVLGHSARVAFTVDASLSVSRSSAPETLSTDRSAGSRQSTATSAAKQPQRPVAPRSSAELNEAILAANSPAAGAVGARPGSTGRSAGSGTPLLGPQRGRRLAELTEFIPGPQTELALTAARQVAAGQATMFNPLYIHGPVGTGKTHLLEGICRQLKRTQPTANVMLLTSEAFANYFTQALRDRSLPSFRQRFRSVDVLLVDDVEFFESKRVFQEEFLHTFTELVDHGRQVVLTGSRHPRLLTKLGDELATRFLSGLVCRLDTPDANSRQKIVEAKAARMSADFAPEALQFVAQRFQSNVRELEGALNCLQTYHSMTNKRVTLSAARQILADLERDCLRIVRLADIERVICSLFGVKPKDLQSESRVRTVSQPRMLAMFLARKHTQSAYTEIGQHFGGRNHSTVMSAERKVQQWLDENSTIQVASQSWTIGEILSTIEQQLLAG
ncbi:MAG: chromosomal replication initiator protein DnaA [Planctomycetes bacterium]|nr:chromosomal replication initiator protein DnaA [Planctomycetota bacterium]